MNGANEFGSMFCTGQYGQLYIVSGRHARGRTFRIYALPAGEIAIPNGESNPPLNENAVEVYGVVSGQCSWRETYGWLHDGKWQVDFTKLYLEKVEESRLWRERTDKLLIEKQQREKERIQNVLSSY